MRIETEPMQVGTCDNCGDGVTEAQIAIDEGDRIFCRACSGFMPLANTPDDTNEPGYTLTYQQGQQVAEILRRYVSEELIEQRDFADGGRCGDGAQIQEDIDYIERLAALFPLESERTALPTGMRFITGTTLNVTVPDTIKADDFEEAIDQHCYREGDPLRNGMEISKYGIETALEWLEDADEKKPEICALLREVLAHAGDVDEFFFWKDREVEP